MNLIDTGLGRLSIEVYGGRDVAPAVSGHVGRAHMNYVLEERAPVVLESGPCIEWERHGADRETN